jgi:hypothetical protein
VNIVPVFTFLHRRLEILSCCAERIFPVGVRTVHIVVHSASKIKRRLIVFNARLIPPMCPSSEILIYLCVLLTN